MKKLTLTLVMSILVVGGVAGLTVGCKHMDSDEHGGAHVHAYTCSMHPEVVQNGPGDCPKCGMKLVRKKD